MASNVSSLPSPNLYPPIAFDTPVNLFLSNRLIDRIAAAIFFLRDPESLVRFISLTDFPIDFIVFIKYGDKYMTRRRRKRKKVIGQNAILISTRWKVNRSIKFVRTFRYSRVCRLTRLAYLIFSAALNLITNAAWASINRGSRGRMSVCTRRIYPVRLAPTAVVSCTDTPLKLCN